MSATPRRDGEATRQKLLRAALELYTAAGFRDTTTPAIAARAGVAEGTIYRHFSGKEDLLNAVYRASQRWALGVIAEAEGDHTAPAPERLQRIARRLLEAAEHDPAGVRMVLQFRDDRYLDERSREAAREVRGALQQVVAAGKSDGLVRAGPADLWVAVWLAVVTFAAERVWAKEWAPDHPQARQAVEAAWNAIRQEEVSVRSEQ
jgi:AcrR family transcriptional regulator